MGVTVGETKISESMALILTDCLKISAVKRKITKGFLLTTMALVNENVPSDIIG